VSEYLLEMNIKELGEDFLRKKLNPPKPPVQK